MEMELARSRNVEVSDLINIIAALPGEQLQPTRSK
jgi:hypothetical protein